MNKTSKLIIVIVFLILIISLYLGWYTKSRLEKINLRNNNPRQDIKEKEEIKNIYQNENLGKIVKVKVNNELIKEFYILKEEENAYTLLAKESLGNTYLYTNNNCNSNDESFCDFNNDYIISYLQENTKDWINVGEIRLPLLEEIVSIGNFKLENEQYYIDNSNEFIFNNSYWIDSNKLENENSYYVSLEDKSLKKDKVYNSHEIVPVIKVIKTFIEK